MHATIDEVDAALARLPASPKTDADLEARCTLMTRRIELLRKAAEASAAAAARSKQSGGIIVNAPDHVGTVITIDGMSRNVEIIDGRRAVRLRSWDDLIALLQGREGIEWEMINGAIIAQMAAARR